MTIRNVAVLFTDVVGSTELSQRLSPEVANEILGPASRSLAKPSPRRTAPFATSASKWGPLIDLLAAA